MQKGLGLESFKDWFEKLGGGRTKHVSERLLKGEVVDVSEYPPNPSCRRKDHRSTEGFIENTKHVFGAFSCIKREGNKVWIPELQKPKSFLKEI